MVRDDDVSHRPERPPGADPGKPEAGGRKKVVLLVEDAEDDRHLYGGLLWYNGFEVVVARDGAAGIEKAMESRPDLVLLDLMLPGELDGIAVARRLRELGVTAPMIALSARTEEELGAAAREAGIVAYLEKPIDPFAVVREVSQWIGYAAPDPDPSSP